MCFFPDFSENKNYFLMKLKKSCCKKKRTHTHTAVARLTNVSMYVFTSDVVNIFFLGEIILVADWIKSAGKNVNELKTLLGFAL